MLVYLKDTSKEKCLEMSAIVVYVSWQGLRSVYFNVEVCGGGCTDLTGSRLECVCMYTFWFVLHG